MPDHHLQGELLGSVFARGTADTSDTAWLQAMLDTEAALARALERAGLVPAGSGAAVTAAANTADFDLAQVGELAALTGNPVPGLARLLARAVLAGPGGGQAARAVHRGATSQDIMDTSVILLARRALDATIGDVAEAADGAARLAEEHRASVMIGRTLLQQAVPTTFGVVAAGWLSGLDAALSGLELVRSSRLAVQFGGAAGTLASFGPDGPRVVALLAEELDLPVPALPWHTERLRIIDIATAMARVTAALSKIARDVTLLAQTEVAEVSEGAVAVSGGSGGSGGAGGSGGSGGSEGADNSKKPEAGSGGDAPRRGGSSAMPNKNNPVAAIAVLGCARQVPGLLATVVASAEQEHQRAAGAWHAEWEPLRDILRLAGSAASWGSELLRDLQVDAPRMERNLAGAGGLPLAERVTAVLAQALGGPRAHDLVGAAAAKSVASGVPLRDVLLADPALEGVPAERIDQSLDPSTYLGASDTFVTAALEAHARRNQHG